MSKIICSAAIRGAHKIIDMAEESFDAALKKYGPEQEVSYPNTAYYLPVIYSMLGAKVENLGDMKDIFQERRKLLPPLVSDSVWLPYLGQTLARRNDFERAAEEFQRALEQIDLLRLQYYCTVCSTKTPSWVDRCENCGEWNTITLDFREDRTVEELGISPTPVYSA